jgi:3D (Asp-Asp-Asp) domain-containing protein
MYQGRIATTVSMAETATHMKTRMQTLITSLILISILAPLTAQAVDSASDSYVSALNSATLSANDGLAVMNGAFLISGNSLAHKTTKASRQTYTVQVSGYNSEVGQTDDTPFITANGTHVRDGIVATNMFPFGTIIKIPSLYGNKIFVVTDRMNSRYQKNVDIWFADKGEALALGRRTVQIEVIK